MLKQFGCLSAIFLTCSVAAQAHQTQLIVKYKQKPASLITLQTQLARISGAKVQALTPMAGGAFVLRVKDASNGMPAIASNAILQRLQNSPDIEYAAIDRKGYFKPLESIPAGPLETLLSHDIQWDEFSPPAGIMLESAPGLRDGAWAYSTGQAKNPVVVAVLDTGVEPNSSLVDNLLKNSDGNIFGWNFADNDSNVHDDTGSYHGSHVSGTIAGYGTIMNGMGEDLKVLTVKIPDASGMFYESAVINGIYWATGGDVPGVPKNPYPAKVLNMSFGVDAGPGKEIDYCGKALQEAVSFARQQGAVVVVAAGNDDQWEHYNAPGVCNGTIKVAATGPEGLRSYYSNYGPGVSLAAPGGDLRYGTEGGILSTVNPGGGYLGSGFAFYQGTSMASPHVAGVAGLIHAVSNSTLSAQTVEQILYATTHDFGKTTDNTYSCVGSHPCGNGILDALNAVKATSSGYDVLFTAPNVRKTASAVFCKKGGAISKAPMLQAQGASWKLTDTHCDKTKAHPSVRQDESGQIYADYGNAVYALQQSTFKHCQIIGNNGVGCFY